jgi:hypothetical protein
MADTRVFKVEYPNGQLEFCNFRAVVQKGWKDSKGGKVVKVYATNAEATDGWTDVTDELTERHKAAHPWES